MVLFQRTACCLVVLTCVGVGAALAQEVNWLAFKDTDDGYTIDLPLGLFDADAGEQTEGSMTLYEVGGDGQLVIYAGANDEGYSPRQIAELLEQTDRIDAVTYRAAGRSWFVMSGYYHREGVEDKDLIFYTKMMFNADGSAFSTFEISYPVADKARYDPIVERLEASLRGPS